MLAGMLTVTNNICRLDRMKHRKIYVSRHVLSTHYIYGPIRYMWEIIYVGWIAKSAPAYMSAGSLKARPHICWLECIKRGKIYVGRHAYSAHEISGPLHYKWLKDISHPRLAGTLYVPLWHIWKYTYSMKIWLKGLLLSSKNACHLSAGNGNTGPLPLLPWFAEFKLGLP